MKKRCVIITCVLLMSAIHCVLSIFPSNVKASTLFVGGGGPGNYTKIQDAIDAASSGDTIYVFSGNYLEKVVVNKTLSLVGEDRDATKIIGSGFEDVVNVTADWANITGFTISDSGLDSSISKIELYGVNNCTISGNNVSSPLWVGGTGISLISSNSNSIINNTAFRNEFGVYLKSSHNDTIAGNAFYYNFIGLFVDSSRNSNISENLMIEDGIHIRGDSLDYWNTHIIETSNTINGKPVYYLKNTFGGIVPSDAGEAILANSTNVIVEHLDVSNSSVGIEFGFSSGNTVADNIASNNRHGIHLAFSHDNTIMNNTVWNDTYGISILGSDSNVIVGNNLSENGDGIRLSHSANNTIRDNTILLSKWRGTKLLSSNDNQIYHNSFINNTEQASDDTYTNQWDNGYPSGGNYWSNYTGYDNMSGPDQDQIGSDGIGDTPFVIDADSRDKYPLVDPLGAGLPLPPRMLYANLSGRNLENLTITWALSPDDRVEFQTVAGYDVYRNMTYDAMGLGYSLIARLPSGASDFVDPFVGEGNPNNYFYRVCTVDTSNNTTCSPNQGSKFTRSLSNGLNLLSIPLIQSTETVETVLQTVAFDRAWSYDSSSGEWKSFVISKPHQGSLREINHTMGFWMNVTEQSNLTVAGIVPSSTSIHLHAGWNLVGFPSFNGTYTVSDLKASVGVERIEGFEVLTPPYFLRALTDGEFLQTGFGYWIRTLTDGLWTVINS